jgi:hypothetical protein
MNSAQLLLLFPIQHRRRLHAHDIKHDRLVLGAVVVNFTGVTDDKGACTIGTMVAASYRAPVLIHHVPADQWAADCGETPLSKGISATLLACGILCK